ncbi:MAG: protein translocase subunit SecD [Nitrospirae bacterium CG_4_9_14_3_um_filter_41_27]|nr:protein translocase subunit SecD [Nitrospirota bacterium]OIP59327.1 MAG: protein-export membrane protein SecD [Nitrospirae bacterium CG2_30_41_42]PIQ93217.1 MAG: protein translocase subunit SecD [Nitrospirae bacterium CG11_big_fil_rev_8_21_14_0_20_41_14]PIV41735.1 MAG: protein translocase subunit SecD [Nitrospirae bacterium CG02_land_8_20_14_3_00_41_53]PIW86371.1 MAG: protein translocase subunit SecD [Nitrospirae bacterium CG_4_8_14_3_um_filter_41_47]PJA79694.1 MAG: protein translocase subu
MKKKVLWKVILISVFLILAVVFFLPNTPAFRYMPNWWMENMPNKGIVLGLDLQGGLHLVFEVEGDKAVEITTDRYASRLRDLFAKKKLTAEVNTSGLNITVSPSNVETRKVVEDNYPSLKPVETGSRLVYRISDKEARRIKEGAADQALETIRNRIDQFGVAEPTILRQGENEIVVQLPGVKDPKRAIDLIGKTAQLEFKLVDDEAKVAAEIPQSMEPGEEENFLKQFAEKIPEDDEILFEKKVNRETGAVRKIPILLKKQAVITGDLLSEAKVNIDSRFNEPYVSLSFNTDGAKKFEEITGANVKKRLAIILDKAVYSAPVIQEKISGGNAQITGNFTMEEAKDLSIVLRAGALPAPLEILQNVTVGPSLGRDSIEAGKMAGIIGTIAVVLFMIFYYRLSGIIADFALLLNIILLLGAMASLNATLTLPGIAGIILAIGMAVDSNVLMFERMRDELRAGKTPRAAVDSGYNKAFWTIFDSHVTTLITAAVLFQFGTGPIKGFAVTLSFGVAINLFTALIGTKSVFDIINSKRELKKLSI